MTRLLVVDAPHFYAGAVWQQVADAWQCTEAAPILRWMCGKSAADAGAYLKRKGWAYQWVTNTPSAMSPKLTSGTST